MEEEWRHASPEGLRSETDAASMVKHDENEKSATQTMKKLRNTIFSLFLIFIFSVFSQSTFSRPDTLPFVFGNRSYRMMFFVYLNLAKTPSFASISGRPSSQKALKAMCFS